MKQIVKKCKLCGKPLKTHKSVKRGYGDVCYEKQKEKLIKKIKLID